MEWSTWALLIVVGVALAVAVVSSTRSIVEHRRWTRAIEAQRRDDEAEAESLAASFGPDDTAALSEVESLSRQLAEYRVTWALVDGRAAQAVQRAGDALGAGLDSPALRELAGLSRRHSDDAEVRDLLERALDELGIVTVAPESPEALLLALRHHCREWDAGRLDDAGLATWAHEVVGHHGPLLAQEIVELDDLTPIDADHRAEFDLAVRRFLRRVAGLTALPRHGGGQRGETVVR